jgi:hypothetical protein
MTKGKTIVRKNFILTKKIAKHGSQAIIIIPRMFESELKPDTIVELNVRIIKEAGK